ncbi:MAG: hypothetical protein L0Y70_26090 [Gemmataceae bacterium]|nr:hypothetical protein [Gemmataceae bacterium]
MAVKNAPPKNGKAPNGDKQKPAHEVRIGRIRATIWANENDNGVWYNVTLTRSYRDNEEWKSSASFGRDDLLVVAKAADLAHTWITSQGQKQNGKANDTEAEEEIPY